MQTLQRIPIPNCLAQQTNDTVISSDIIERYLDVSHTVDAWVYRHIGFQMMNRLVQTGLSAIITAFHKMMIRQILTPPHKAVRRDTGFCRNDISSMEHTPVQYVSSKTKNL